MLGLGLSITKGSPSGLESAVAESFLLDTNTGAESGYSFRKLRSGYSGSAIKVRREIDDQEQDIGFGSDNELDTAALSSFCGSSIGYVTKWYDQVGSNDFVSSIAANQPRIYSGNFVYTVNQKPVMVAVSANTELQRSYTLVDGTWIFSVTRTDHSFTSFMMGDTGAKYLLVGSNGNTTSNVNAGLSNVTTYIDGTLTDLPTRDAVHDTFITTQRLLTVNLDNDSWTDLHIGYPVAPSVLMHSMQEFILYESDQSSNRASIESDINDFYNIYS